jgi:putative transposase
MRRILMAKQTKVYKHSYPSDLTNDQWATLKPLLQLDADEPARTYSVRDIMDAIFYLNRTGCAWRYLPENLPPWQNVQYYFYKWTNDGTWERVNASLRKLTRVAVGKQPDPTAGSIDAQSVKTTEKKGTLTLVASMPAKRLRVVSDTYWLIRSV